MSLILVHDHFEDPSLLLQAHAISEELGLSFLYLHRLGRHIKGGYGERLPYFGVAVVRLRVRILNILRELHLLVEVVLLQEQLHLLQLGLLTEYLAGGSWIGLSIELLVSKIILSATDAAVFITFLFRVLVTCGLADALLSKPSLIFFKHLWQDHILHAVTPPQVLELAIEATSEENIKRAINETTSIISDCLDYVPYLVLPREDKPWRFGRITLSLGLFFNFLLCFFVFH
mmetsp:Transcript_14118/g.21995  ORF Transcript_14118/g.21995 Transcript_14118/m.21995 type:complete len:231 (-) Transcript_14118:784-1476(-)